MTKESFLIKHWIIIGCSVTALFVLYFVWPTPYEYTRKAPTIYRVSRISGVEEQSTPEGWRTTKQLQDQSRTASEKYEAETAAQTAKDEKAEKEKKEKLATIKLLGSSELKGIYATVWGLFRDGSMRYRVHIRHTSQMQNAVNTGSSLYHVTVQFDDKDGFPVYEKKINVNQFIRIVDDKGKTIYYEFQDDWPFMESEYQSIHHVGIVSNI